MNRKNELIVVLLVVLVLTLNNVQNVNAVEKNNETANKTKVTLSTNQRQNQQINFIQWVRNAFNEGATFYGEALNTRSTFSEQTLLRYERVLSGEPLPVIPINNSHLFTESEIRLANDLYISAVDQTSRSSIRSYDHPISNRLRPETDYIGREYLPGNPFLPLNIPDYFFVISFMSGSILGVSNFIEPRFPIPAVHVITIATGFFAGLASLEIQQNTAWAQVDQTASRLFSGQMSHEQAVINFRDSNVSEGRIQRYLNYDYCLRTVPDAPRLLAMRAARNLNPGDNMIIDGNLISSVGRNPYCFGENEIIPANDNGIGPYSRLINGIPIPMVEIYSGQGSRLQMTPRTPRVGVGSVQRIQPSFLERQSRRRTAYDLSQREELNKRLEQFRNFDPDENNQ